MDFFDDAPTEGSSSTGPSAGDSTFVDGSAFDSANPVFADGGEQTEEDGPSDRSGRLCLNCGVALRGDFCHFCGQRDQDLDVRFRQLVHDWLGGVIGFDARLWRTLRILFTKPGQLTLEFLAGRRVRYVSPLRFYLVASLLMLLALSWSGYSVVVDSKDGRSGPINFTLGESEPVKEGAPEAGEELDVEELDGPDENAEDGDGSKWIELGQTLESAVEAIEKNPKTFDRSFRDYLPQALFLLVPVFAFQLWVLFRRRFRRYLHHLIFSLHAHTVVFLLIAFTRPFDVLFGLRTGASGDIAALAFLAYLFMAFRRVYGDGRIKTGLKMVILLLVHSLMLSLALLGAVVLAALRTQGVG